ncbi:pyridoxal phosphate-dependent aminotransferase [Methylocystis bryophila]|uniref:Aminotransferase n=1 Tax=Methylocystis bryophila TaxID=655015 RepID=A0A1W6N1Y4_9HYPH|nr:aminotransferase class I/II-fold pyridoxal phosphate-dependent enzyme [Methylocystis bryophila]ARN83819.1 1-aminocyclopropane-1-carboxylate deaminase [Methylocystis bryophila]
MAMDVLREARRLEREGRRIVHMELGEPGAPTPRRILDAAQRALAAGAPGYGEAAGDPALRTRIARHYQEYYGVALSPERVMITTGSSGAFLLAFLSAFDIGARIGVTAPGYPAYLNILEALGLVPAPIEIGEETRFAPTAALIEAAHRKERLDGLLLMSPANPTGTMIASGELARIAAFCEEAGVTLVADEIYHGLEYEERAPTALRFWRDAIIVNSFSKYYAMTGWRLGWIVAPENLARPIERLQQSLAICAPTLAQRVALEAFEAREELEAIKAGYAKSRALLIERLPKIGLPRFAPPDGAFYIYADVTHLTRDSAALCARMLAEAGVAATPGVDFDRARGGRTLRLSYAGGEAEVAQGLDRLADWLRKDAQAAIAER